MSTPIPTRSPIDMPDPSGIASNGGAVPRPPAVMGPSSGTNGRPPSTPQAPETMGGFPVMTPSPVGQADGMTGVDPLSGARSPNSPFRLPGPPPGPVYPEPDQTPVTPSPAAPASPGAPAAPQPASVGMTMTPPAPPPAVISSSSDVPAGMDVDTQIGKVYNDPASGATSTTLNSAGKAGFQRAYASQLRRFGSYHGSDDPGHPKPPITPGYPAFNPDQGTWSE